MGRGWSHHFSSSHLRPEKQSSYGGVCHLVPSEESVAGCPHNAGARDGGALGEDGKSRDLFVCKMPAGSLGVGQNRYTETCSMGHGEGNGRFFGCDRRGCVESCHCGAGIVEACNGSDVQGICEVGSVPRFLRGEARRYWWWPALCARCA